MKIGFSGTRYGMTEQQIWRIREILNDRTIVEAHHGDCMGADAQFHRMCKARNIRVVIHPPRSNALRAHCDGDKVLEPKTYKQRNRDIVNSVDMMIIAYPKYKGRGTFDTLQYAISINKPVVIVFPNGAIQRL